MIVITAYLSGYPSQMPSQKGFQFVTSEQAGVQKVPERLDSRLHGNDRKERLLTFHAVMLFRGC